MFSDARITSNFAIPLGYEKGEDIPVKLGQIMDHKNFRDVEVLTVLNWKSEEEQFTILYNIDSKMNRVDFPATGGAYLGTYKDENHIYIVSNPENYLQICDIDILSHSHEIKQVSYKNLVRFSPDLAEAMTVIKDGVLYLGEKTYNHEEGTVYSTISSYDLVNERKLNELHFENERIYNLSFYEDTLVALMSTGKDEKGYYQELTYHEIDAEDLADLQWKAKDNYFYENYRSPLIAIRENGNILEITKEKGKITLFTNLMNAKVFQINDMQLGISGLSAFGKKIVEQPENEREITKAILEVTGNEMFIKVCDEKSIIPENEQSVGIEDLDMPINIIDE